MTRHLSTKPHAAIMASVVACALVPGGCRTAPPLPNIDSSRFQEGVANAIGRAMAEAKADPADTNKTLAACKTLHAHEQYHAAGQCYARAYVLDPKRFDTLYCWGHALSSDGAYAESAVRLKQALEIRPDSLPAQLKLAEVLTDSGDAAAAVERYKRILTREPNEPRAHYGLARALVGDGAEELRRSLNLFPRYGAAQFALAAEYRRKGDEARAKEILRDYERDKLLTPPLDDPDMASVRSLNVSATGLIQRATGAAAAGHLDEAASLDERAVAADPKLTRAYTDLISLYARLGRDSQAAEAYRTVVALDPGEADAYYNYGVFCFERGKTMDAQAAFERAVELQPRHAEALNNLGAILEEKGNWGEAAAFYRRAIEANPAYPLAHFHIGRIYANQRKYALAIAEFERSLDPSTENTPTYLYALAATHARAGNRQRAVELLRDAKKEAVARRQEDLAVSIDRDLATLERNP
jgi:tetratricopeptide (TPR) repeat protein